MTKGTTGSVDAASAATSAYFSNLFPGERYEVTVEVVSGNRMSSPVTQQVVTRKSRIICYFYRPQRSCEGYVFTRVFDSVHGGCYPSMPCSRGVCYPSMHCRWYPSMTCSRGSLLLGGLLLGGGVSAPVGSAPGGCLLQRCLLWGGACFRGGCGDPPQKQTATVADGTHPTGMHSCLT